MHDCSVSTGDAWLENFLRPLLRNAEHGVIFVLFDEGSGNVGGGGHVTALALGPLVRSGSGSSAPFDHYSLLRTIEDSQCNSDRRHLALIGLDQRVSSER